MFRSSQRCPERGVPINLYYPQLNEGHYVNTTAPHPLNLISCMHSETASRIVFLTLNLHYVPPELLDNYRSATTKTGAVHDNDIMFIINSD